MAHEYTPPRPDGRVLSSLGFKQFLLDKHTPRLAYDSAMSAEAFGPWKQRVRAKVLELMRFPEVPPAA